MVSKKELTVEEKKIKRKEYQRMYEQKPETKAKRKAYRQSPEAKIYQKKRGEKYEKKPETKAKRKAYWMSSKSKKYQRARQKKYHQTPKFKKKLKIYHQTPEYKVYQKIFRQKPEYKKQQKEYTKKYLKEHPELILKHNRKRRARKNNIIETFSDKEWLQALKNTFGICPKCNKYVGIHKLTLDHIHPISKAKQGQIYTIDDVQPLCKNCNSKKQDYIK